MTGYRFTWAELRSFVFQRSQLADETIYIFATAAGIESTL